MGRCQAGKEAHRLAGGVRWAQAGWAEGRPAEGDGWNRRWVGGGEKLGALRGMGEPGSRRGLRKRALSGDGRSWEETREG